MAIEGDQAASVIGLGVRVSVREVVHDSRSSSLRFSIEEYAELSDGREVIFQTAGNGWSIGGCRPSHIWPHLTRAGLEREVLVNVITADQDTDERDWNWLATVLAAQGVRADAECLSRLDFRIELDEEILRSLAQANYEAGEPWDCDHPESGCGTA